MNIHSETTKGQAEPPADTPRVRVEGGQSLQMQGGVHSVVNETPLATRIAAATPSSVQSTTWQDCTLKNISYSQIFNDGASFSTQISRGT